MSETDKWDRMLRQALASEAEPDERLNRNVIHRYMERKDMRPKAKRRVSIGVLVAVFTLLLSVSAFAAVKLLSPQQVAEHLGNGPLAEAFASGDAVDINESVVSGGYEITLHGLVSGAGLNGLDDLSSDISPEKTYAVVSIANADGSPMPKTSDPEYGEVPFYVSPLMRGLKPWQVNIFSMHGGYSETVLDGVMYRLIECDGVEMFADRGVYLAVVGGTAFPSNDAIAYDEETGEISLRPDYEGAAALFDLPLDKSKADPAKAEAYLRALLEEPEKKETAADNDAAALLESKSEEMATKSAEWKSKIPEGTTIPESVQKLTPDDRGRVHYNYDVWNVTLTPDLFFPEGQTGDYPFQFSERDGKVLALVFTVDSQGDVTGKVVEIDP
jgi:hypothetical protein